MPGGHHPGELEEELNKNPVNKSAGPKKKKEKRLQECFIKGLSQSQYSSF